MEFFTGFMRSEPFAKVIRKLVEHVIEKRENARREATEEHEEDKQGEGESERGSDTEEEDVQVDQSLRSRKRYTQTEPKVITIDPGAESTLF